MEGMEKIQAIRTLVESAIVWRAQNLAWNVDIYKAETLLFRLIFKEGSQNPQAMDLLARIYTKKRANYGTRRSHFNPATRLFAEQPRKCRTLRNLRLRRSEDTK